MLVDSHCHLDFPELVSQFDAVLDLMQGNGVTHALSVSVTLEDFPKIRAIAETYPHIFASVGVHPDYADLPVVSVEQLTALATHPKVVAIGETGLDYFRLKGDLGWQRDRFRTHIRAARVCGKPLIIHTRSAADDTLRLMREENASEVAGVMHCFTENWDVAEAALEMGFYISFSGIVTFKNAKTLKEVAQKVPLERLLVETDSPYLAPVPHRGKTNQPGFVLHVAEEISRLRGISVDQVCTATTENFQRLFRCL